MPTLVYWKSDCKNDADCYSVREKTRKECKRVGESRGFGPVPNEHYGRPRKITVTYSSALDLLQQALCEGGLEGSPPDEPEFCEDEDQ
jgi:hypothetical protein